ncbi:MAG: hypothetical protein EBT55_03580 [Proteobacteria bacterium]|nr:hypothetical protein [Pseudomonadota bacterium]
MVLFLAQNSVFSNVFAQEINPNAIQNATQNVGNNAAQLTPQTISNIYAIEGIEAKAIAKSPILARNLAFENAKKDAFLVLLSRLNLPPETIANINNDELSSMVRSERVLDEKIANNTYLATFNIVFAKNFVDHVLKTKNLTQIANNQEISTEKSENNNQNNLENEQLNLNNSQEKINDNPLNNNNLTILVPIQFDKLQPLLWEENNLWKPALEKLIIKNQLHNQFIILNSNLNYITVLNAQNIKNIDFDNIKFILDEKKANSLSLVFLKIDNLENKAIIDVVNINSLQKTQFRLSFASLDLVNKTELINSIANKTIEQLKNKTIKPSPTPKNNYSLQFPIKSYQQWQNYQSTLQNSGSIAKITINNLSFDNITITLEYNGKTSFSEFLTSLNFEFQKLNNIYFINSKQ